MGKGVTHHRIPSKNKENSDDRTEDGDHGSCHQRILHERMGDNQGVLYDIKTFKTNIQHEDVDNMLVFRKEEI